MYYLYVLILTQYRGDGNKIRGFPRIPEPVQFVGKPISLPPTTRKSVHSTLSHRSSLGSTVGILHSVYSG